MAKPLLSVIILNFNHKYFPRLALEALEKSKTNFPFEIIFIDNASNPMDESVGFMQQAADEGRAKFIKMPSNVGFAVANNRGMKEAQGEYVFIHNPDITVKEDSLQKMIDYLKTHPGVGLLGAKLVYANGDVQPSCRRLMTFSDLIVKRTPLKLFEPWKSRLKKYLMEDFDHNKVQEVDLLVGAVMVGRRDFIWEQIGGFDERYFLFMEDFDLCREVWKAGKRVVYYPEVEILHYHKRLSGGSFVGQFLKKTFWMHVKSAIKYFWKWR